MDLKDENILKAFEQETFGQELFTQELLTPGKVHVNVSKTLIIATEDRMNLWLGELITRVKKQTEWIAPFGLFISIALALTTSTFNDFIFPASTWHAIFAIVGIISFIWFLLTLRYCFKPFQIAKEIDQLKTYSPDRGESEGRINE